jgi:hypothetical protein
MKANELRLGNWVKVHDPIFGVNTYKVATIRDNGIITLSDKISCLVSNIEPIELTEEVLVKIGFEIKSKFKTFTSYEIGIRLSDSFVRIEYTLFDDCGTTLEIIQFNDHNEFRNGNIKYLHELQNAYYCLTNEELEVEL